MAKNYETIYIQVISLIDKSLDAIMKKASTTGGNIDLEGAISNSQTLLEDFRKKINKDIIELQENAEWDTFTIAFYGETNAGKSTLIETLRILLKDSEKLCAQKKFNALAKELRIDPESLISLEQSIQQLKIQFSEGQEKYDLFKRRVLSEELQQISRLTALKSAIEHKRKNLSLWQRLVFLFRKMEEENALSEKELQLVQQKTNNKFKLDAIAAELGKTKAELNVRLNEQAQVERSFSRLVPLQDGHIIGNGSSDFTRQSQAYQFTVNDQKFQLIDVPGIEGDEKQVMSAIDMSVKKAHAIFYVTRSAQPPGSGSDGQEGTIHKIKRQLGKQTEVWAIYNKSVTNPQILKAPKLINENDSAGLSDLGKSLTETLGKDIYRGHHCVSGMPAFLASASCLVPNNPHVNSRAKFLKAMSGDEILDRSGMNEFIKFLRSEICQNFQRKIYDANLKKIRICLQDGMDILKQARDHFSNAAQKLQVQQRSASKQIDELLAGTEQRLKSECKDQLNKKRDEMRKDIYNYISTNQSNDDFKGYLTAEFEKLRSSIGRDLEGRFTTVFDRFKWEANEIIKKNQKNVDDILHHTIENPFSSLNQNFKTDFKMKNGINMLGLISTLGGAAGLIWTTFLASNPAGWTVAAVLGAVGLVFSFYKAVRSLFSSDYKKEQQRKSADENLENIFSKLNEKLNDHLESASKKINEALQQTKSQLRVPHEQCANSKIALEKILIDMRALHEKITPRQTAIVT